MSEPVPAWVAALATATLFFYQTMDAIDGKQARRTNTSSPLGELFDHGCDAVTTAFLVLNSGSALRLGPGWHLLFCTWAVLIPFYLTQWEEYFTHILALGYLGVTEAQIAMMLIYCLPLAMGPDFWIEKFTVADYVIEYKWIPVSVIVGGGIVTTFSNFAKVAGVIISSKNKLRTAIASVLYLIPLTITVICSVVWYKYASIDMMYLHPHTFNLMLGFVTASLVGRIIVARVCGLSGTIFTAILIPLMAATANAYFFGNTLVSDTTMLHICLAWSILTYLHFALSVIDQLCGYLQIKCLSIPVGGYKKSQ